MRMNCSSIVQIHLYLKCRQNWALLHAACGMLRHVACCTRKGWPNSCSPSPARCLLPDAINSKSNGGTTKQIGAASIMSPRLAPAMTGPSQVGQVGPLFVQLSFASLWLLYRAY